MNPLRHPIQYVTSRLRVREQDPITFTVGLGSSIDEAYKAQEIAKRNRSFRKTQGGVHIYDGDPIPSVEIPLSEEAEALLKIEYAEVLSPRELDALQKDPRTGLYKRGGLEAQLHKLRSMDQRFIWAFADGDRMKAHNTVKGQPYVDELLAAAGTGLREALRTTERCQQIESYELQRRSGERRATHSRDVVYQFPPKTDQLPEFLASRVHGSGGDEFLIALPLKPTPENYEIMRERFVQQIIPHMIGKQQEKIRQQRRYSFI